MERNILVQNNYVMYGIVLLYLFFVKLLGPNIMMKRKPLDLKIGIILFNSALVASNLYLSFNVSIHFELCNIELHLFGMSVVLSRGILKKYTLSLFTKFINRSQNFKEQNVFYLYNKFLGFEILDK